VGVLLVRLRPDNMDARGPQQTILT
jgi:hypothetical protein